MDTITQTDGRTVTRYSTKETAAAIRAALKTYFPGMTFSVRTQYFSMGSATRIAWTDGPTDGEVSLVKRLNLGRGPVGKTPVLGMRERGKGGRTLAFVSTDVTLEGVHDSIYRNIEQGSTIHTDEAPVYEGIGGLFYQHGTVNHTIRQYRHYDITTNGIESVFAVLKRGIIGVYHRVSVKHLGRYVHEFTFRLNEGNVSRKTVERLDSFIAAVAGKRLTYAALIQ